MIFRRPTLPDFSKNLVAYYKLDEAGTTAVRHDAWRSNHLTPTGSPVSATGKNGDGVDLEAATPDVLINPDDGVLAITGAFTISCWIKAETLAASFNIVLSKYRISAALRSYRIEVTSAGALKLYCVETGTVNTDHIATGADGSIVTGTWYHVVGAFNPSQTVRLYLNGVLHAQAVSAPPSLFDTTALFNIGNSDGQTGVSWDGVIDEVGIWNAYRPELVAPLYNSGLGRSFSNLGTGTNHVEKGLTLKQYHATGTVLNSTITSRSQPCVYAVDLTIPGSPSGLLFEMGNSTTGAYIGFRAGGQFVARCGASTESAPTASSADMAVVYLTSGQPSGTGTLVWEFNPTNETIRVWWNNVLIGTGTASTGFLNWTAAADGGFNALSGTAPTGEVTTALGATYLSQLRYYENQTVLQ